MRGRGGDEAEEDWQEEERRKRKGIIWTLERATHCRVVHNKVGFHSNSVWSSITVGTYKAVKCS